MIIYLAGPMTGLPDHNYPAFADAAGKLRGRGMEVRSPHEIDGGSMDRGWGWYMRAAIAMLLGCEKIVLLPGWEGSRGARLERWIAQELGMPISMYTDCGLIPAHLVTQGVSAEGGVVVADGAVLGVDAVESGDGGCGGAP